MSTIQNIKYTTDFIVTVNVQTVLFYQYGKKLNFCFAC